MTVDNMTRLNGKTAVMTGGATGIGLAAAKRGIEEGASVFIFGRRVAGPRADRVHRHRRAAAALGLRQGRWLAPDELVTDAAIS